MKDRLVAQDHIDLMANKIRSLETRIKLLETARGVRPTRWIYVGTYPGSSDTYLAGSPWEKYVTPDSPPWESDAYPIDPYNSPVRFRLLIDRDVTPEIEGGFIAPTPGQTMWTMPAGLWRIDVAYVIYPVANPASVSGTTNIQIYQSGAVVALE